MNEGMNQKKEKQINIELGEKEAEGTYSNLVLISHSPAEFVFDFIRVVPGKPKAKVYSRIIMAPQHAKSLLAALQDNVTKYEHQFGEIKLLGGPPVMSKGPNYKN
jgi:Protein of unknown function (DUF3467)